MTSIPIGRCCIVGVKHEGIPIGEVKKIRDVRTYSSYPLDKSIENAIHHLQLKYLTKDVDIFGIDSITPQLLADQFTANGYLVLIPDLFDGKPLSFDLPLNFDLMAWVADGMPRLPTVDPVTEAVIKEMRGPLGVKRIGGVGYCFGGKHVCRRLKEGGLDAGFTAHPSFVDREEVEGIKGPLIIAAAETDEIFPAPKRRETEDSLEKPSIPYQISLFSDVVHSFAAIFLNPVRNLLKNRLSCKPSLGLTSMSNPHNHPNQRSMIRLCGCEIEW